MLAELGATGSPSAEYFYLNGQPLALYTKGTGLLAASQLYYYHDDHLGTPQVMTDGAGAIAWKGYYDPFGRVTLALVNKVVNNLRLPGQYNDSETGFYQNGFRDYDPSAGRYIESDRIGLGGGINTYAYVGGSPISRTDFSGLLGLVTLNAFSRDPIPESDAVALSNNFSALEATSVGVASAPYTAGLAGITGPAIPEVGAAVCAAARPAYQAGKLAFAIYRGTLGSLLNGIPEETIEADTKAIQQLINNATKQAVQAPKPAPPVPTQPYP